MAPRSGLGSRPSTSTRATSTRFVPGKRPRTTLTPTLVTRDGAPAMVLGTQGGDQQDQWTLQVFLNQVVFGMDVQDAIEAYARKRRFHVRPYQGLSLIFTPFYQSDSLVLPMVRDLVMQGGEIDAAPAPKMRAAAQGATPTPARLTRAMSHTTPGKSSLKNKGSA